MNQKNNPEVSVIIATYNRPDALRSCLQGVINQSIKNWVAYVIGDNCSNSTKEMIDSINDNRIVYYNNPHRFGEQPGGNNIGIAFSKTEFIAFLNHDDIWTPDHLATALKSLKNNNADFFVGRSILYSHSDESGPILKKVSSKKKKPHWSFSAHYFHFEPCSTWVVRNSFAKKVGYWKQSIDLHRFPIQEYIMRSWRKGAKFVYPEKVTCIRMIHHLKKGSDRYSYVGNDSETIFELFKDKKKFEKLLDEKNLIEYRFSKNYWQRPGANRVLKFVFNIIYDLFVNRITGFIYLATGVDSHNVLYDLLLQKRGINMKRTLQKRTGESELKRYNMDEVVREAKQQMEGII